MKAIFSRFERGQSIILVALALIVLLGLVALSLDGGYAYANRRVAQNAADAAALAGARELCMGNEEDAARAQAIAYAAANNVTLEESDIVINGKNITVTGRMPYDTFVAGVLGRDEIGIAASASAGCYLPCTGQGLLPVAWYCQPYIGGEPDELDCEIKVHNPDDEEEEAPMYLIMDSEPLNKDCQDPITLEPSTDLDCDFDDDGVNDIFSSGTRGWLDMDGGSANAAEMKEWVRDGYSGSMYVNWWYPDSPGTSASVFQDVKDYQEGNIVYLPVFNDLCSGDPRTYCPSKYLPGDNITLGSGASTKYYRIQTFSAFMITCVSDKPNVDCPEKTRFGDLNGLSTQDLNNVKTIEGYFVEPDTDNFSGRCGEGGGAGIWTLYLNK